MSIELNKSTLVIAQAPWELNASLEWASFQLKKTGGGRRMGVGAIHSPSSGKVEMFLCAACHDFTPHVNAWKS